MLNSPILNLVILLSFTYFVGSIMLSAINESLSALLKTRAKDLVSTLQNFLLDPRWKDYVNNTLLQSQHIKSLMNNENQPPSYVPARNFLYTMIEAIKSTNYNPAQIQQGIDSSALPDSMKSVLSNIWAKAQNDATATKSSVAVFEDEVENYYNNAMDRASGWYKRKTRRIMIVLGFVLAAAMNIDTIKITNDSLSNPDRLNNVVDKIVAAIPNISVNGAVTIKTGKGAVVIKQTIDSNKDTGVKTDSLTKLRDTEKKIEQLEIYYNNLGGYQLGYTGRAQFRNEWFGIASTSDTPALKYPTHNFYLSLLLKILGLLLTAFALQLGSNYWFDLLNKAVNLRATGKKPDEKKS